MNDSTSQCQGHSGGRGGAPAETSFLFFALSADSFPLHQATKHTVVWRLHIVVSASRQKNRAKH